MAVLIDSSRIRPGRVWYALAGVVFGLSLIAGFAGFLFGVSEANDSDPKVLMQSSGSTPAQLLLSYTTDYVIYVEQSVSTPTCTANPSSDLALGRPQDDPVFKRLQNDGRFEHSGKTWKPAMKVIPHRTHTVALSCGSAPFLVGDLAPVTGSFFGGAAGLVGLPCLGFVIALTIGLITVIRRSGSKKRLQIEAAASYGPNPYQGPLPYQQPGPYGGRYPPQY